MHPNRGTIATESWYDYNETRSKPAAGASGTAVALAARTAEASADKKIPRLRGGFLRTAVRPVREGLPYREIFTVNGTFMRNAIFSPPSMPSLSNVAMKPPVTVALLAA